MVSVQVPPQLPDGEKENLFIWKSPVLYGHEAAAVWVVPSALKLPQVEEVLEVVIVTKPGDCEMAPGTLHSFSLCEYSPCREITVQALGSLTPFTTAVFSEPAEIC
jgi:hypothetical protein